MDWTFAELKAALDSRPQFVQPIADNIRRCIVERIQAALELAQYGDDGAQGREVFPKFAADYNSERGFVETVSPVLIVVPANSILTAESGIIPQAHIINVIPDIHHDIKLGALGGEQAQAVTTELLIYVRAITYVLLSMKPADFIANWPVWARKPGGIIWNINEHEYDGLRKGGNQLKRAARIGVEVRTVEA